MRRASTSVSASASGPALAERPALRSREDEGRIEGRNLGEAARGRHFLYMGREMRRMRRASTTIPASSSGPALAERPALRSREDERRIEGRNLDGATRGRHFLYMGREMRRMRRTSTAIPASSSGPAFAEWPAQRFAFERPSGESSCEN